MTNAEFYRHEIRGEYRNFCSEFIVPNVLKPAKIDCGAIKCAQCHMIKAVWLLEEHKEPEIDWENVSIDTPILGRDNEREEWVRGHFAKFKDGRIGARTYGGTSFTSTPDRIHYWTHAKLWEGSEEQAAEQQKKQEAMR